MEESGLTGMELEVVSLCNTLQIADEELLAASLAIAGKLGPTPLGEVVLGHAQRVCQRLFELLHLPH